MRPSGQSLGSLMADTCGRVRLSQGQGVTPFPEPEPELLLLREPETEPLTRTKCKIFLELLIKNKIFSL